MFCKNCGLALFPDTNFCPNCGAVVNQKVPEPLTMGCWDEPGLNPHSDSRIITPQETSKVTAASIETGEAKKAPSHIEFPQKSNIQDSLPPYKRVFYKKSRLTKNNDVGMKICPACRGTGKLWMLSPAKVNGHNTYHAHQKLCFVCSGTAWISPAEEENENVRVLKELRPFKDSAAHENCEFCGGSGTAIIVGKDTTFSARALRKFYSYPCPAYNGTPILKAEIKKRKKLISLLLCLPFGFFVGAHSFYEGKTKKAWLMFVLMIGGSFLYTVIPPLGIVMNMVYMIWWFIDLIIILTKKSEYEVFTGKYIE